MPLQTSNAGRCKPVACTWFSMTVPERAEHEASVDLAAGIKGSVEVLSGNSGSAKVVLKHGSGSSAEVGCCILRQGLCKRQLLPSELMTAHQWVSLQVYLFGACVTSWKQVQHRRGHVQLYAGTCMDPTSQCSKASGALMPHHQLALQGAFVGRRLRSDTFCLTRVLCRCMLFRSAVMRCCMCALTLFLTRASPSQVESLIASPR